MSTRMRLGTAITLVLLLVAAGTLGGLFWPLDPDAPSMEASLAAPSAEHPLGADQSGRDILARILAGARTSLLVASLAVLLATVLGSLVGVTSGMGGTFTDTVLMRTVDFFNAFPQVVLVIFLASLLAGGSFTVVVLVLGFTTWMGTARLVRAEVLSLKERDFMTSARASGAGALRLAVWHLLPNLGAVILVTATLRVGNAILLETSLSFLGLGVPSETPSWGRMVHDGYLLMREAWWIAAFPGLAITLATVGFNLLGDGLRDRLDPRRR